MKVYVVLCTMEGCEECGNEVHIVAVRTKKINADEIAKKHSYPECGKKQDKKVNAHLHWNYVDVVEVELDGTPDYKGL